MEQADQMGQRDEVFEPAEANQGHLDQRSAVIAVFQLALGQRENVETGEDGIEVERFRLPGQRFAMTARHAEIAALGAGAVHHHQIAPVGDHLIEQFAQLQPGDDGLVEQIEGVFGVVRQDGLGQGEDAFVAGGAEQTDGPVPRSSVSPPKASS